jgi:hypothetical protein
MHNETLFSRKYWIDITLLVLYSGFLSLLATWIVQEYLGNSSILKLGAAAILLPALAIRIVELLFKFMDKESQVDESITSNTESITNQNRAIVTQMVGICIVLISLAYLGIYALIQSGYQSGDFCLNLPSVQITAGVTIGTGLLTQTIGTVVIKPENKLRSLIQSLPLVTGVLYFPILVALFSICGAIAL